MDSDPGQVELGRFKFDLSDDAELMAFYTFVKAMSGAGVTLTNRHGEVAGVEEMVIEL